MNNGTMRVNGRWSVIRWNAVDARYKAGGVSFLCVGSFDRIFTLKSFYSKLFAIRYSIATTTFSQISTTIDLGVAYVLRLPNPIELNVEEYHATGRCDKMPQAAAALVYPKLPYRR